MSVVEGYVLPNLLGFFEELIIPHTRENLENANYEILERYMKNLFMNQDDIDNIWRVVFSGINADENPDDYDQKLNEQFKKLAIEKILNIQTSFNQPLIDLKKISIIEGGIYNHRIFKRWTINYNGHNLIIEEHPFAGGTYGEIYKVKNKDNEGLLAIKLFKYSDGGIIKMDTDIDEYDPISRVTELCRTINALPGRLNNIPVVIMPLYDGNLSEYIEFINKLPSYKIKNPDYYKNNLRIILHIAKSFLCLKNHNMSYYDIKSLNIMFKRTNNNLIVSLGDLGSICNKGTFPAIGTYPLLSTQSLKGWKKDSYMYTNNDYFNCDEKAMIYGLGILLLEIFNIEIVQTLNWLVIREEWLWCEQERPDITPDKYVDYKLENVALAVTYLPYGINDLINNLLTTSKNLTDVITDIDTIISTLSGGGYKRRYSKSKKYRKTKRKITKRKITKRKITKRKKKIKRKKNKKK